VTTRTSPTFAGDRAVRAIVRRDLRVLMGSPSTLVPMLLVPLVLFAGLPLLVGVAPSAINLPVSDVASLTGVLPADLVASLPADPDAQLKVVMITHLLAPMLLIVPVMLSVVAAAGAIAGERERGTLETLLLSPVSDRQLFLAKTAGTWVPTVLVTVLGAIVYQLVGTWVLADLGVRPFPNLAWTLLVLWVAPALAAAALGAVVLISARAESLQGATQLGGALILPLVAVAVAQATGALALGTWVLAVTGLVVWGLAALLLRAGARAMARDRLATRLT
jgi:ABC-2 type transport system permease protein